jgi:hypothetical protein
MNRLPHPVPDELPDHAVSMRFHVLLNRPRDVHNPISGNRLRDARVERLLRDIQ